MRYHRNIADAVFTRFIREFRPFNEVLLTTNYRSTGYIVGAARCVIEENTERKRKELRSGCVLRNKRQVVHLQR